MARAPINIKNIETLKVLVYLHKNAGYLQQCYLHRSVTGGRIDMIQHLLQAGYDVNMRDFRGNTPIHYVPVSRPLELFRLLVENGTDVCAVNKDNKNVAHILVENFYKKRSYILHNCVAYTLENGFLDLWNFKDKYGYTPFEYMSQRFGSTHPTTQLLSSKLWPSN